MYKIGDKVETPLGIGSIYNISDEEYSDFTVELFGYEKHIVTLCNVNVKGQPLLYKDTDLKPHRTAHEKLIEMGYELTKRSDYVFYRHDDLPRITIYNDKTYSCSDTNLALSRILTQYLEEL